MTQEMHALISYRLEQADEALQVAQLVLEQGNYRTVVNRTYYAMFYAILALLVPTEQQTSRHAWVMTLFDRDFVKLGIFKKEFSTWLHEAFDLRQQADYREMIIVSPEQAETMLAHAQTFVAGIKEQLQQTMTEEEGESADTSEPL